MRVRTWWMGGMLASSVASSLLLISACSGAGASTRPAAAAERHPEVDTGLDTCAECHAQVTPKVATAWRDGRHGMSLVECVVCHGSTGADFKAHPTTAGCAGCHSVQAAVPAVANCFGCHPAHALRAAQGAPMPHPAKPKEAVR